MAQITLNVALPKTLEAFVEQRVAEGGYRSPGDYVSALIREDQERRAREKLDRLLLGGLDSEPDLATPEYLPTQVGSAGHPRTGHLHRYR